MEQIHIDRLLKLADHLKSETLGHDKFYFGCVSKGERNSKGCGTLGCAMGELPFVYPNNFKFVCSERDVFVPIDTESYSYITFRTDIMTFFDIDINELHHLFYPNCQMTKCYGGKKLNLLASKNDVAQNIREFIKVKTEK